MKSIRTIMILFSVILLAACGSENSGKAKEGGINSGGGNTLETAKANASRIKKLIPIVHQIAPYRIRQTEYNTWMMLDPDGNLDMSRFDSAGDEQQSSFFRSMVESTLKPFASDPLIYDVIDEAKFQIQMDKSCFDNQGNERDGSIAGLPKFEICLSPYKMARTLDMDNVYKKVLGLMAKEYGRHTGLNDKDALNFQSFVGEMRTATLVDFRLALEKHVQYSMNFQSAVELLDTIILADSFNEDAFIKAMDNFSTIQTYFAVPSGDYLFMELEEYFHFYGLHYQIYYLQQYRLGDFVKIFENGKNTSNVGDLVAAIYENAGLAVDNKASKLLVELSHPVEKIQPGDLAALKKYYNKIRPAIEEQLKSMEESREELLELNELVVDFILD